MNIHRTVPALLASAVLLVACSEDATEEGVDVATDQHAETAGSFVLRETKPTATNTGAGIIRPYPTKVINGNVTLNQTGQVLADTIVHGQVIITAPNVLVSNCVVDGGAPLTGNGWVIQTTGATNARIEYTTVRAAKPTYYTHGIGPREYTAYRCDVSGVVDAFSAFPKTADNPVHVSIQGCYGHDLAHFSPDPNHTGTDSRTHNDVLQSQGGIGVQVIGSNFAAYHDPVLGTQPTPSPKRQLAAIMINSNIGTSAGMVVEDNWLGGGVYCVNGGGAAGGRRLVLAQQVRSRLAAGLNRRHLVHAGLRQHVRANVLGQRL